MKSMTNSNWRIQYDGFEDHSIWNVATNKKIAEKIVFFGCADQLVRQLEWGLLKEENIVSFKIKETN